jgi:phage gp46-like protein
VRFRKRELMPSKTPIFGGGLSPESAGLPFVSVSNTAERSVGPMWLLYEYSEARTTARLKSQIQALTWLRTSRISLSFGGLVLILLLSAFSSTLVSASDADVSVTVSVRQTAELVVVGSRVVQEVFDVLQTAIYPISDVTVLRYRTNMSSWKIEVASDADYFYSHTGDFTPKPSTDLELYADDSIGWVTVSTNPKSIIVQRNQPAAGDLTINYRIFNGKNYSTGIYKLNLVFTLVQC